MTASFYICDCSFLHNGSDTPEEVCHKLLQFKEMIDEARQYTDNEFYLQSSEFCQTTILSGHTIAQLLEDASNRKRLINRDCLNLFMGLFKICKKYKLNKKELLQYLELEDENYCNGILVLNPQSDLPDNHQVISTVHGWMQFRRFYLGKYPQSPEYFLMEAQKYYKQLRIHEDNKTKYLKEILQTHSQRIAAYLSVLNDHLLVDYSLFPGDFIQFMPIFSGNYDIDDASFEGTKADKFKCTFLTPEGKEINVYCEPHLKMYKDDSGNRNQHGRIYFQAPQKDDKCIYVGIICKHL